MKSPSILAHLTFFGLLSILLPLVVSAQDSTQGGGGGESAAESSVTSSSSKKAAVLPEVVESNPIVTIIRSGLPINEIKKVLTGTSSVSKSDLRSITRSGNKADLKNVVTAVKNNEVEIKTVSQITTAKGSSKNALGRAKVIKTITEDMKANGIESTNVESILSSLLDPTIETFGSNSDSASDILEKVNGAVERVAIIVDVEDRIAKGELNDELAASILSSSTSTNPASTFNKTSLEKQVVNIVKIVEIYGGDAAAMDAVANNSNLEGLLSSDLEVEDIIKRTETIKDIEDQGLSGSEVDSLIEQLNNTNNTNDDATVDIDAVIADAEQKIAQSVITGNTEFNDDSSDGGASSGDDSTTIDLDDYDLDDADSVAKLQFVGNFVNDGISQEVAEEIFEFKDQFSLDLNTESDRSKLSNIIKLGFSLDEIKSETSFDYDFYSAAYLTEGGDSFSGGLNIDQAKEAKSLGYEISELNNLSKLVNNLENDDSYTVGSLAGKDLALIVEALELDYADFSQAEALAIGGSSYTSQDLDSINTLKNSVTYYALTGTPLDDEGSFDYSSTSLDVDPITVNEILGFSPSQISSLLSYDDPGVSYALFRTLQNFRTESDIDTNLEGIGQLVSDVLANRSSFNDAPSYNADDILNKSYIDELAYFLDNYNILGQNGSELLSFIDDGNSLTKENYLSSYIKYLAAYTGSRTFGDDFDTAVADIPLDNVTLLPGANFTLSGDHDVSSLIEPATLTNNNVDSDDIKILVAGAAKDFTITGDLTIHNDNKVEDHALVLAAADDFYLRSEYSSENSQDYTNPETINIEYTGSNLAIASQDTMVLVNANITTGGNLAIGTLDELHIGLSDNHHSIITLGEGGNTPSPDNLYLYANDLISVNGLDIEGYVSKVYMEAHTLALRDVMFPESSRVMLRSKVGELNFNPTPIAGYVNLYNSGHESIRGGADLVRSDFEGSIGHYNSVEKHPNGEPYISVRAQQAN